MGVYRWVYEINYMFNCMYFLFLYLLCIPKHDFFNEQYQRIAQSADNEFTCTTLAFELPHFPYCLAPLPSDILILKENIQQYLSIVVTVS